jgi:hypothetical protein
MKRRIIEKVNMFTFFKELPCRKVLMNYMAQALQFFFTELLNQLFAFDRLYLFHALNHCNFIMIVIVFEITKADKDEEVFTLFQNIFKVWKLILLSLVLIFKILKVKGLIFLYSIEMNEFTWDLEFKQTSFLCLDAKFLDH